MMESNKKPQRRVTSMSVLNRTASRPSNLSIAAADAKSYLWKQSVHYSAR